MVLKEKDSGYTSSAQSVWNELYVDTDTNKIYEDYLADSVDMWLFNTESLYNELKNKRRKSYSIVYEALLSLFQSNVNDNLYPKKVRVTSEMVQSWFRKHNADFKVVLKPVVDKVEEERQEMFSENLKEDYITSQQADSVYNELKNIFDDFSDNMIETVEADYENYKGMNNENYSFDEWLNDTKQNYPDYFKSIIALTFEDYKDSYL